MSDIWTLLIADDCAEDREVYREYLLSDPHQSYQILEAASAEVGLALCQKKRCDAILLDFCLPDMSGLEFLDELKQQQLKLPLPVIMLTGQGDERVAVQAIKRGALDYLVKQHLQPDVLQLTVRNVIQQSQEQNRFAKTQERQQLTTTAIAIHQDLQVTQALVALEKEKQLNVLKSQLIATISHEYRTPLTAILGAASTLKQHSDKLSQARQQRFLQIIEDKARQMAQMVDDLLVIETLEFGKAEFRSVPFELLRFFSDIIEEQRQFISDDHELTFKITGNTKGFWGDRKLLRQITINLLSNAIKYSPDGGHIEVHLMGNDSHIIFDVKDEGIGIPVEDRECLFQSFSRGSNVGIIPGLGLGLAIVKACVELHSGEITLESQADIGTKVTVSLPKRSV
ncbi:ATP-binding protein [Dendronalium sp. ChiSLP03b]|uniref:hybrid sensor histidine kinase/response regulator n=1 Tax=Dendronalium sp. ChiSLP03b TaxID=3075381 RepID=UPI002AD1D1DC|nr:ATP-binding protein [Dendronalium sp. ChiSLP03b]MDZ8205049.1 ATP-binding protein [Dendronalium sp. ChiSLP03b]